VDDELVSAVLADTDETKVAQLRAERDRWRNLHARVAVELADTQSKLESVSEAASATLDPPRWLTPKRPSKHEATLTAILSDCHWDEVVKPSEVGGINAYNRDIATLRLERWARGVVEQSTHYVHNVKVTGAVIMLGGDMLTGNLHDLAETNEDHLPGSLVYWAEQLSAALTFVADGLDVPVHVPVVVGNHGRLTHKPRTKGRARDNLDWLIAHMAATHLKADGRFTWQIDDDADAWVQVHDTTYLLTHGDQVKGGGGIGGIWPPIMRMLARKRQRYQREFIAVMGHWHQLIQAPGQSLIVNGSTKGMDEYAAVSNFAPERPQQAAWLTTPEHGPTLQFPIFCGDRKAEGW
jgi:hypothetical protein